MRFLAALFILAVRLAAADLLIVADEFPAMENLSRELAKRANLTSDIVRQDQLPADLAVRRAVIVYIHRDITPEAEHAFIDYARRGGRLILLHHSISSGKRKNKDWLPFLGVELPTVPFDEGGYKYFDPADFEMLNQAPQHPVMKGTPDRLSFEASEIYLNHVLSGPRTTLLAIRYTVPATGKLFEQPTGGWYRPAEKGDVFYFMAGHKAADFLNPAYAQMIANAVLYRR